ncbi:MAG: MerR family transcriptional regulator, partial [bacterium]|nr:MerR family transcriptional regulator [bacterium]
MQAGSSFGIGRLAELSGLPIKTIRFYSDLGILEPARTEAGHRRYDAADLARLQLVHGLRELGVGLPEIRSLLEEGRELRQVLTVHANALEVRVRGLQRQLVVTRGRRSRPLARRAAPPGDAGAARRGRAPPAPRRLLGRRRHAREAARRRHARGPGRPLARTARCLARARATRDRRGLPAHDLRERCVERARQSPAGAGAGARAGGDRRRTGDRK